MRAHISIFLPSITNFKGDKRRNLYIVVFAQKDKMSNRKEIKDILKAGKAKAKARLEIALGYLKNRGHSDLIRTGHAKKKSRARIVHSYLSGLNQSY